MYKPVNNLISLIIHYLRNTTQKKISLIRRYNQFIKYDEIEVNYKELKFSTRP